MKVPISLLFSFGCCLAHLLSIQDYDNLISQAIESTKVYKPPESNIEFKAGSTSKKINDFGKYHFIIVGAGSSGSVLATRLSEIDEWDILLLEAGGEENDFSDIPVFNSYLQVSDLNWGYYSTPQKNSCLGMKDNKCVLPRGKALGGCSAINGLVYARGNSKDYDGWAKLGNSGWSYQDTLPYFKKSENSQIDGDTFYHGKGGFHNVEYALPETDFFKILIEGNAELNVSRVDCNGRREVGICKTQSNTKRGKRQSLATAFLANARKRANLKVITKALVTKINIDSKSKTAQGVVFVTNNQKFYATATKEVIVSAGAFNTPQLLMLSGIGPKNHLEGLKIDVIEDLPVGQNFTEHPMFVGLTIRTNQTIPTPNITHRIEQYLHGYGPLTRAEGSEAVSFLQVDSNTKVPMIEHYYIPPTGIDTKILKEKFNFEDHTYLTKINTKSDLIIFVILLHPKSRGTVTLKSNDPIDFPNIDVNMLAEPEDIDVLTKGIEAALKLLKTDAFKKVNATFLDIPICKNFEKFSKQFWECAIRNMTTTVYHPCGTASMGKNKSSSVVDSNLQVHGINKLRVVDASVFPTTISGHPNAAVVMIAEKIADVIKRHYKKIPIINKCQN